MPVTAWTTPPEVIRALLLQYNLPDPVLDMGTGAGAVLVELARARKRAVGIDPDPDNVREAVKRSGGCQVIHGDVREVTIPPGTFKSVVTVPPVGLARLFVQYALDIVGDEGIVCALAPIGLWDEPIDEHLAAVHPIKGRISGVPGKANPEMWAWFIWQRGFKGIPGAVPFAPAPPTPITKDESLTYDPDLLTRALLILGCPRSGTTLLQQVILACWDDVSSLAAFEIAPTPLNLVALAGATPPEATLLWKTPEWPRGNPHLFRKYLEGGGRVLGILRDPRSCLNSRLAKKNEDGDRAYFAREDVKVPRLGEAVWRLHTKRMLQIKHDLGDRCALVTYEDLLCTPTRVAATVATMLGAEPRRALATWHEAPELALDEGGSAIRALGGIRPLDPTRANPVLAWADLCEATRDTAARAGYDVTIP